MNLKIEQVLQRVREKLNQDNIKLWTIPYYIENIGPSEEEIQKLAEHYSNALNINLEHCSAAIRELQNHALEKLQERNRFKETGVATLKIRIPVQAGKTVQSSIPIRLNARGLELKNAVAKEISSSASRIKLICQGKVLKDDTSLENQNVKNGSQLMAVILTDHDSVAKAESQQRLLESTREDLKLLTDAKDDDTYLQLEDQSGNTLSLPPEEKKALITAMTFHEKGRAALKSEDYSLALVMLLEADNEFSRCNSQILSSVDNYALLNLDIAWCYLCLRSANQIPDAEERLRKCEENFHRSYGPNLERVVALKGSSGNEACLFMRLHLLQAIVMFHKNRFDEARRLMERAERELESLKVDEVALCTLMELGFSAAEARIGLRATHGDVNAASEYITRNREERTKRRREAFKREALERESKLLGKCADGKQFVNPQLLDMLVNMGFSKEMARIALQQSNNIISQSVQIIQENPELLEAAFASTSRPHISDDVVEQVAAIGYDPRMVKAALKKHYGNVEKAIEELAVTGGVVEGASSSDDEGEKKSKKKTAKEKEMQAIDRLKEGLSMVDDDHLDLTLVQEEEFLKQYKKLLDDI